MHGQAQTYGLIQRRDWTPEWSCSILRSLAQFSLFFLLIVIAWHPLISLWVPRNVLRTPLGRVAGHTIHVSHSWQNYVVTMRSPRKKEKCTNFGECGKWKFKHFWFMLPIVFPIICLYRKPCICNICMPIKIFTGTRNVDVPLPNMDAYLHCVACMYPHLATLSDFVVLSWSFFSA